MAKHNETGLKGEQIAEKFLLEKGYAIVHRNWRSGRKEVDIIAVKDDIMAFVEVKTRKNSFFGFPEEHVSKSKQDLLREAAMIYVDQEPTELNLRFDIISVLFDKDQLKEIVHFEDAFY